MSNGRRAAWPTWLLFFALWAGSCAAQGWATPPRAIATPLERPTPGWDAAPLTAQLLYEVELPLSRIQGLRPLELSALAWDPELQNLWAASDRGLLFCWQVNPATPSVLKPLGAWTVQAPARPAGDREQGATRTKAVNPETLAWRTPSAGGSARGELWLGSEYATAAWRMGSEGQVVATESWPSGLGPFGLHTHHGIEAMAWHPRYGLLAAHAKTARASQVPHFVNPPGARSPSAWHGIQGGNGAQWWFAAAASSSQIKAIETMGRQGLLILERIKAPGGYRSLLRWLALESCGGTRSCQADNVPFEPPLPAGPHNDEGLACTDSGLCWMVSDGTGQADSPARLLVWLLAASTTAR
jgi:hypothetical protein